MPDRALLFKRIADAAARWPDRIALDAPGESWTYRQLITQAQSWRAALAITPNEPVVVLVSNQPNDITALLAVWRAGGVAVPVHRGNPPAVIERLLERTGARFLVDAAVRDRGTAPPPPRPLLEDAALIIFTSGSTGEPKGAVLTHGAFAGKLDAIQSRLLFGAGERTLLVLNMSFSFGIWVSLLTLLQGGTLVMRERFSIDDFSATLVQQSITRTALVPTMLRALFAAPLAPRFDAIPLRQLLVGGESLGAALAERTQVAFPTARLIDIYGLTETSTSDFMLFPADYPRFVGCIGRVTPNVRYRIAAAIGEIGELQISTPYRMAGYLDAPALTAAAFEGEWFRTGDLARARDDGVVELAGRAKEIISRGGIKTSPLEIEQAYASHPAVAAAMAIGVPDALLGERIHLLLVPRVAQAFDLAAVNHHAHAQLAKPKRPDRFYVGGELPLGRTGKADRGALRRLIESGTLPGETLP